MVRAGDLNTEDPGSNPRQEGRKVKEAAWLSGQSWGFEYGRPGFKSPTGRQEC